MPLGQIPRETITDTEPRQLDVVKAPLRLCADQKSLLGLLQLVRVAGNPGPERIREVVGETIHGRVDLVLSDRKPRQAVHFQAVWHAHGDVV